MEEIKTIEIFCDKESLLDSLWLFNNIPWANHDNKNAKIIFNSQIEVYSIMLNGYDTQTANLKKFVFDNVMISAMHGFAGNSYTFCFKLGDELIHYANDISSFAYSIDDVKNRYITKLSNEIEGLRYQINYAEIAIKKIIELN